MHKFTILLPLLLALGCIPDAEQVSPRDLSVRPSVQHVAPLSAAAKMLAACVTENPDGPVVSLRYEELSPPDLEIMPWVLTIEAPPASPRKVGECIRGALLDMGAMEIEPEPDTSSGGESSTG